MVELLTQATGLCVRLQDGAASAALGRMPTRFSIARGKWGEGTARIDGAIAFGSATGRWAVADEVFPELEGAQGVAVPVSDHLLIELRRKAARPRPELEQRPVAVLLDGTPAGRKIAAAYSGVTTGAGFAETLRADADAVRAAGGSGIATLTGTLRKVGEQVADEVRAATEDAAGLATEGGGR